MKYAKARKHTAKATRKAIGKQLGCLRRDLEAVDSKLSLGKALNVRQLERFNTIRAIFAQQKYMYDHGTHSVPDRIVSVSQPFVRPIVRGKAGKPAEFGAKLDMSVIDGWTRLGICRTWRNASGKAKATIPTESWPIRSTETGRISASAKNMGFGSPVRHWDARRSGMSGTMRRLTAMNVNGWKWSVDSVWQSESEAWDWSPQSGGKPPPM